MTADVNVTERVARELIADAARSHLAMGTEYATRLARRLLAVLSDPEVLAGMAGVLAEHVLDEYANTCSCGKWGHFEDDYYERVATYTAHVATALADWIKGQG